MDVLKPKVVFLENVKNLATHDRGLTFEVIQKKLKVRDYVICAKVLNAAHYSDVPQNRERIYIVCFKDAEIAERFKLPERVDATKKTVRSLLETSVSDEFSYAKTKFYDRLKAEITDPGAVYQWRRMYVRKNKSGLCPTLTANMGTGGHNVPLVLDEKNGIRKLTPRECARLQGFPDDYRFPESLPNSVLYKQIGNSVSVPVVRAIAEKIMKALEGNG